MKLLNLVGNLKENQVIIKMRNHRNTIIPNVSHHKLHVKITEALNVHGEQVSDIYTK